MKKVLDVKTPKTRGGIKKIWKSKITLTIEEGSPKTTVARERRLAGRAIERDVKGLPPPVEAIPWYPPTRAGHRENILRRVRKAWSKKAQEE